MSASGQAVEVRIEPRGSELVADAAAGASTVTAQDPTPFEVGGQVAIDGTAYEVTSVAEVDDPDETDSTNAVLTLSPALSAAVTAGTRVDLWSGTQVLTDVKLDVVIAPDEPPITVTVNANQRKDWAALEGPLEPPITVTLSDDLGALFDAPGYSPTFDLTQSAAPLYTAAKGADQTIPDNTWTTITGWFTLKDDRIHLDALGQRMTVDVDGWHDIRCGVTFANSGVGNRAMRPVIYGFDGSLIGPMRQVKIPADGNTTIETAQRVFLYAGQSVSFEVWHTAGANLAIRGSNVFTSPPVTDCSIRWEGPA